MRCGNESFRLAPLGPGTDENIGRLEMCYNGYWGSVCDDVDKYSFRLTSAMVACRELGYSNVLRG